MKKSSYGLAGIRRVSWAGAAALVLLAPAVRAQGLFDFFDPSPQRIEIQLERAGYELRAPIVRRGDVYTADVLAGNGALERLVIDAHTTKIVGRYPARARGWREAPPDWRNRGDYADVWPGAPRPPRAVGPEYDDFGPICRPTVPDEFTRADPSAPPGFLYDDPSARGANVDRPRPKPHVVAKPKPSSPAPVAKAAPTAPDAAQAPDASAAPVTENAKSAHADVAAPAVEPVKPAPAAEPAKPAAEAKPVAEATAAPPAPQPRPSPKPKALNDLPVTPLD